MLDVKVLDSDFDFEKLERQMKIEEKKNKKKIKEKELRIPKNEPYKRKKFNARDFI